MFQSSPVFSSFSVDDLNEARSFYQDTLGCTVEEDMMGLRLTFPNGHIVYIYQKDDHQPAVFTVLNFPVDSIDAAIDELMQKEVVFERYDSLPAPQDDKGVLRGKAAGIGPDIVWFKDPAGNVLAVLEA